MELQEQNVGGAFVVRVRGAVHMGNSPRLRIVLTRILKRRPPAVLVSLDRVRNVDTSGLATLVECAQRLERQGGRLLVAGLKPTMTDSLSLAQVKGVFPVFPTEAEALEQLRPATK